MMYAEFTALAKRSITEDDYHKIVEPVYNYHPACVDKPTTAKLYDLGGLQLFRDMTETAGHAAALEAEADGLNKRLAEIKCELHSMTPGAMPLNEEG